MSTASSSCHIAKFYEIDGVRSVDLPARPPEIFRPCCPYAPGPTMRASGSIILAVPTPPLIIIQDAHLIADAIPGTTPAAPKRWPGDRFDMVWVFELLAGDS